MLHTRILRALRSNIPPLPQHNRRSIDIIALTLADLQFYAVRSEGLDVKVAVAGRDGLAVETGPWGLLLLGRGGEGGGLGAVEETVALLPFEVDEFGVDVCEKSRLANNSFV